MKTYSKAGAFGYLEIISLENGREVWRSPKLKNRILDAGLALLIQHHAATASTALAITSLEIGTGSTAVAGSQTALAALALAGVIPAKVTASAASIEIEFFITDAELANGTYREVMLRAGPVPYTRALFGTPYVKAAGRDTIIRYTLGYSAV